MRRISMTIAVSATLALAACGGDGGPGPTAGSDQGTTSTTGGDSPSSSADTPTSTSTSGAASSSSSASSSGASSSTTPTDTGKPFDAKEFTNKLEKAIDENPTVKIDVKVGTQGQPGISATGVQDLKNEALEMELDLNGQKFTYRLVDGTYYLSQPPKWVPVTKDSSNPVMKQALTQVSMLSMRTQLDAFIAGVESAGDKGTEDIDGVSTTHYTATVNTDKALSQLGIKKAASTPDTVIYDVWLDDDDLLRKMSFTQNGADATMTATDWGKPVTITKPKDSELAQVN